MSPFDANTVRGGELRGLRLAVELVIGLAIAFLGLRTWGITWFVVASGSMAPALVGPHAHIDCGDCGFAFDCGIEGPESLGRPAVCPNCGAIGDPIADEMQSGGDRLPVHQLAFATRLPRRWEIVAFRSPARASEVCVKRVVGLPGETVEIREGDVFIDGQILRKSLPDQRAMAVLVNDNAFRPQRSANLPPRSRAEHDGSRWLADGDGFVHPRQAVTVENTAREPSDSAGIDWLTYHHQRRVPGMPRAVEETPLVDAYGYNQTRPVLARYAIHDVLLACHVQATGDGIVAFRACDGEDAFVALLYPHRKLAQLHRRGQQMVQWERDLSVLLKGANLELSLVDRQFLLALDGEPIIVVPYERMPNDPTSGDGQPTSRPLAIASLGCGVEVSDLRVFRDVYYVPAAGANPLGGEARLRLGADQFYVLGDNSPLSHDSRTGSADAAAVPAKLLLGKPLIDLLW